MKNNKKIFATIFAVVFLVAMAVPAMAAPGDTLEDCRNNVCVCTCEEHACPELECECEDCDCGETEIVHSCVPCECTETQIVHTCTPCNCTETEIVHTCDRTKCTCPVFKGCENCEGNNSKFLCCGHKGNGCVGGQGNSGNGGICGDCCFTRPPQAPWRGGLDSRR